MGLEQGSMLLLPRLQGTILLAQLKRARKGSLRHLVHHVATEKQCPRHNPLQVSPDVVLQACQKAQKANPS